MSQTPTFYIFHGEDDMSVDEKVSEMRAQMYASPNGELNTAEFDGQVSSAGDVIAAASAYPFLADKRLVIVRGMLAHIGRKGAGETGKKAVEMLLDELPHLPPYARVIFAERQTLSDSNKILKLAQEKGFAKLFAAPKDSTQWIIRRAKEAYSAQMQPRAAAALASVTEKDLRRADNELIKLVSYVDGAREITEADVALLTPYVQEANLFEMVDALAEGRAQVAAALLHRLLDDREDPFSVFGMIVRQFRLLLLAKEHLATGGAPGSIADALRVHRYVAEKLTKQSRAFSVPQLEAVYRALLDYDVKMKTGRIKPELALDLFIAGMARQ